MPVRRPVCLICLLFLLGIYVVTGGPPKPSWDVDEADGKTVTVTGTVADRQEKAGTFQVYLTDVRISDESRNISDSIKSDQTYFPEGIKGIVVKMSGGAEYAEYIRIGARVRFKGVFAPFDRPRCEGMFDSRTYYLVRGYEGQLKRARLLGASGDYGILKEKLRVLRDASVSVLQDNMSESDAGLVAAMTLGDKSDLDPDIRELYQNAGISHVLALSGLHIASVGLALLGILRRVGIRDRLAAVMSGTLIILYAIMTGMSVSTARALIMFLLSVGAILAGRTYDLISAAALSAVIIPAVNPYYVYDTGFLLSFLAIIGIAFITPVLEYIPRTVLAGGNPFAGRKITCPSPVRKVWQGMCVSIAVMLATFPVMANSFMQVSVGSVIINLFVIPLMGVVLVTGFCGIIIGLCGLDPSLIFKITHYILLFFERLAAIFEKNRRNMLVTGKPGKGQLIAYVIITITAVIVGNIAISADNKITPLSKIIDRTGRHLSKDNIRYRSGSADKITYIIKTAQQLGRHKKHKTAFLALAAILSACAILILITTERCGLEIRNVDVGQGDCALLWGKNIPAVMIDGGSTDINGVGKYRIVPVLKANRATVIEYCFLSHMDSDHVSGILEILEDEGCGISIRNVVISEISYVCDRDNENMQRLIGLARKGRCAVSTASAGDEFRIGDMSVTVIAPDGTREGTFDTNDASLVLRVDYGDLSGVFTGDISEDAERRIADLVGNVTYLKVAHHGSRTSSSDAFLRAASPTLSVISVGEDNNYGHPAPETLERLKSVDSMIFRTDTGGEVIVYAKPGRIQVTNYLDRRH